MNEDFDKIESIDYTSFEEKFFEEVRNGKKYQHFLNLCSQMDCMFIRSVLSSMNIPTYIEGENVTADNLAQTAVVINNAGSVLPSTGGIGTTIFYIIGAILEGLI